MLLTFLLFFLATVNAEDDVFQHPITPEKLLTEVLAEPAQTIGRATVIRGQFTYRKHLADIPAPLESTGEFLFIKNTGIAWHTTTPFDSEFIITPHGIAQREPGKPAKQSGNEQAALRAAARIFLSLLSLDIQTLRATFKLHGVKQDNRWQLGLKPTAPAVAAIFRAAVVAGGAQIDTVSLQDTNGDRTEIIFNNTVSSRDAPTPQELQRFAP